LPDSNKQRFALHLSSAVRGLRFRHSSQFGRRSISVRCYHPSLIGPIVGSFDSADRTSQSFTDYQITCHDDLTGMAEQVSEADKTLSQMRFLSTFFQNGLNRILKMIGSESFSFVVNGHRFESTIVESIFLSPEVEEMLLSDLVLVSFVFQILQSIRMIFQFFLISFAAITIAILFHYPLRLLPLC
jgi:hypothetical protein